MNDDLTFAQAADLRKSRVANVRGMPAIEADATAPPKARVKRLLRHGPVLLPDSSLQSVHLPLSSGVLASDAASDERSSLGQVYQHTLVLIGQLHAQFLNVITDELDRRGDIGINSVQALLLFNLGDQEVTVGSLETKGHYLGVSVSHNLRKLVDAGYIHRQHSGPDRRLVLVRLTNDGIAVRDILLTLFERHLIGLEAVGNVGGSDLRELNVTLKRMQRFWFDQVRFRI